MSFFRSPELRAAGAVVAGAAALLTAVLAGLAARSDFLMLDFRRWELSSSRGAAGLAALVQAQPALPEQRPLRLSLALAPPLAAGDFAAAEREVAAEGTHCLRALAFSPPAEPEPSAGAAAAGVLVLRTLVNGAALSEVPLPAGPEGIGLYLAGLRPRAGRLRLRFELRAGSLPEGAAWRRPAAVHVEYATLRRCAPAGEAG